MDTARDFESLEIKTKSIEQTLLPLVKQISTLINHHNECAGPGGMAGGATSARVMRAVARVGQAVSLAVDRFVTVGETIADDNPEIREDMYESCKEARAAGCSIEKLCQAALTESITDRGSVVRAARCLLGSVTRVLLLADIVVVKQLLLAQDKVARSLGRLEGVSNFTEFVKAFSQFGAEMVELAHLTGDRHGDLKDGRRRAQMAAARQVLERSTMMLLTSSKTCLRHPECLSARENRDTVFCQMRRAMDLIHYVVKDGVLDCAAQVSAAAVANNERDPLQNAQDGFSPSDLAQRSSEEDWDASRTVVGALRHFESLVELTRLTALGGQGPGGGGGGRERLAAALEQVVERTQDFTDSAYTSHEHRENILLLCERAKLELNQLLRAAISQAQQQQQHDGGGGNPNDPGGQSELESSLSAVLRAARELRAQLQATSLAQSAELGGVTRAGIELMACVRNSALASDTERLEDSAAKFSEHLEHVLEVCKLLRHVAATDALQVSAKYTEINLRIYGPQVVTAAHTLAMHPTSKIAKENLEVFADMWHSLMADVTAVSRDVTESCRLRQGEKQVYMSLPRPGKHGTTSKQLKPSILDSEEQAKIAKAGLEMKLITSEMDAETDRWQQEGAGGGGGGGGGSGGAGPGLDHENNDIVKRAKNMSSMAFSMYQFTRGEGALKTTQDLFTQAEYFAEEANRLYKVVRQFSYQVPGGMITGSAPQAPGSAPKKELLAQLDGVPTHVQQLQFTVKTSTVGKAATFTKVDAVITQTKSLMNVIAKVVSTCFLCATKYALLMPEQVKCPVHGLDAWLFPAFLSPQALSRLSKTI